MKRWKMPQWMEPYRDLIVYTGGQSVEDLMNGAYSDDGFAAVYRWSVRAQVRLLTKLHNGGIL